MAAPVVAAQSASVSAGSSLPVDVPAGGGLLIAAISAWSSSLTPAITAPGGWTLIDSGTLGSGTLRTRCSIYSRVASSEPASYTWTTDGQVMQGLMLRITGFDGTTPIEASSNNSGTDISAEATGITSGVADTLLIAAESLATAQTPAPTSTPPTGFDELDDWSFEPSGGVWAQMSVAKDEVGSGATGTKTFTLSATPVAGAWATVMIAVNPGDEPIGDASADFETEVELDVTASVDVVSEIATPDFDTEVDFSVGLTIVTPGAIPYTTVEPSFDDSNLWTEVVITRAGGDGPIIVTDEAAVAVYGEDGSLQLAREGLWSDDNQGQSVGERLLVRYSTPRIRFPSIVPVRSSDLWGRLLSLRVNDRITIRKQPRNAAAEPLGAVISQECWISGIKWNINRDAKRWNLALDVVPAEDARSDFFIIGTDALGSDKVLAW